jgi:hypothetical protein
MKKLQIGIDIDNTINVNAQTIRLFVLLTNCMKEQAEIHIITHRDTSDESRQETISELEGYGVHYDVLAITANKYKYIMDNDITVYIDDTDEYFQHLPESVTVLKMREPGNFDFDQSKWIYGNKTGINIDDKKR